MKIAVPTEDKKRIFPRTGRASFFAVYNLEGDTPEFVELRINRHHEHDEHGHHSHADLIKNIGDCQAIVLNNVGVHLKRDLDEAGIQIFKTGQREIDKALKEFTDTLK